ncbi:MAG: hypothetical protein GF364_08705 [Candidatus Lokiarchaeota archaeon]|nr:hypothetical protein [Candidatus Lokiarchaeota archaeon]
MKAGFSSKIITPDLQDRDEPLRLGGFLPREYCTGVHDDLYIRGVYIEGNVDDLSTHILMLVGDVIAIDKNLAIFVKRQISQQIPIQPRNIMISATHTHHGPDYKGAFLVGGGLSNIQGFLFPRPQTEELIRFGKKIIQCAVEAYNNRLNVCMAVNQVNIDETERVMINRRAPFDYNKAKYPVTVIKFCRAHQSGEQGSAKRVVGAIVNYAMHGTVLPRYNTLITADYVGYVIKYLENKYPERKGNFIYFNGPCGEINPLTRELQIKMKLAKGSIEYLSNDDIYDQRGTWEDAKRIGETIGKTAFNAMTSIDETDCKEYNKKKNVSMREKIIRIPLTDYNFGTGLSENLNRLLFKLKKKMFIFLAKIGILKSSVLISVENLPDGYVEAYLQAITIGELNIYTIPGEFFLKLGQEIMEYSNHRFPDKKSCLIELANNSVGYLYTVEAFVEGGYESGFSLTPLGGRYLTMKFKQFIKELDE